LLVTYNLIAALNTNIVQSALNNTAKLIFLLDTGRNSTESQLGNITVTLNEVFRAVDELVDILLPGEGGKGELGGIGLRPSTPTETTDMFPLSVAPHLSTPAQIQNSAGLVSLQHHRRAAVSSQL
jgi:hypothetical protein